MYSKAEESSQIKFQKSILLRLRWVVIIATSYLVIIDNGFNFNPVSSIFLLAFALSNFVLGRVPYRYFASRYFYPVVAASDICLVTAAIYAFSRHMPDFYVVYFFIIMLSAIGENIKTTLLVASAAALIYIVYLFKTSAIGPELPMRIIFLFVVAIGNAFMVENLKKERQGIHYLEERDKIEEKVLPLQKAVETTQIGVTVTDINGKIIYTNPAEAAMHGYTVEELMGKNARIFAPPQSWNPMRFEQIKKMKCLKRESVNVCKDGTIFPVQLISDVVINFSDEPIGIITTCEDITERKRAEEALHRTNEFIEKVMDNSTNGIFALDKEMKFQLVNRRFSEITGYSAYELIGRLFSMLFTPDYYSQINEQFLKASFNITASKYETELICKDKNKCTVNLSIASLSNSGDDTSIVGTIEDITRHKQAEDVIKHIAYYDTLTGLPNRILFYDRLANAIALARRNRRMLAVLFLDMDRFKTINDTLGHNTGDLLLQAISERLKRCVREVDAISRVGGDEFTIVLHDINQNHDVDVVAHKLLRTMSRPYAIDGHELFLTTSIGISLFPSDGDDIETLVKNADTAMYKAKELGRNNYQFYAPSMNSEYRERLALENSLRKAVERKELLIHYQPQVDLRNGKIIGVEALLRWQHPVYGLLLPSDFIPLAEETGLIISIGEWIMHTACAQNRTWQKAGFPPIRMAVNLSMRQFRQKDLLGTIDRILKDTGLAPNYLDAELTESIVMQNAAETINILRELRAMGIHLTIDDFGTGYSSLSYLKYLPISKLKLSHSFVHAISIDPNDEAISKAIIVLANSLNIKVIAEGIETAKQVEFLRLHNCDEGQGYLFGRPVPAEEFTRMLSDERQIEVIHGEITAEKYLLQ